MPPMAPYFTVCHPSLTKQYRPYMIGLKPILLIGGFDGRKNMDLENECIKNIYTTK